MFAVRKIAIILVAALMFTLIGCSKTQTETPPKKETPVIFLLWGSPAKTKAEIITNPIHIKLTCVHPSPLSAYRGFFGCKHFSKTNAFF